MEPHSTIFLLILVITFVLNFQKFGINIKNVITTDKQIFVILRILSKSEIINLVLNVQAL